MELKFTEEEQAFREEVRQFIADNLPEDMHQQMIQNIPLKKEDIVSWTRVLDAKGWSVPHWPKAYGGTGWGPMKQYIYLDELQCFPAPEPLQFNVNMVGPVIYTFGSEEQKKRFLPSIRNMDVWWCQGFSEPGAGSDLASLRTQAVRDGDHFIVNGQKTWTTLAQYADWIFCLVRTNPDALKKQAGISFLLIDMKTPGIEVRPIITMDGAHEVNEVFFNDVRVPIENLVGEENKGWDYAKFLLGNERSTLARVSTAKERAKRIRAMATREFAGGRPLIENPNFSQKLTALELEIKALEITLLRVIAADAARGDHGKPDPASSILKIKGSQIQQRTSQMLMEVMGPFAIPFRSEEELEGQNLPLIEPDIATTAPTYFNYRKTSIYGGSNEIQKNIIAKAVLGF